MTQPLVSMSLNDWIRSDELFDAIEDAQDIDAVRILIERGCDVNMRVEDGWTPLMAAANVGSLSIVKLLIDSGADANALDDEYGSALGCAKSQSFQHIVEYLEPLCSERVRASAEKWYGRTSRE